MFKKAERRGLRLKIGIAGPSGSGKTLSALRMAQGIGGRVAAIDTENRSLSLYKDHKLLKELNWDVCELSPPYTTAKYIEAIEGAVGEYDVLVIDSLTHAWAGEGGILNRKEQVDARGGNSFTNWAQFTPEQEKFTAAILHADIHVIATMRSKQDYVMAENSRGKQAPKKVGLKAIQREGFEYELTTVFDVDMQHHAQASKDRTGMYMDKDGARVFQITQDTGKELAAWAGEGVPMPDVEALKKEINDLLEAPSLSKENYEQALGGLKRAGKDTHKLTQLKDWLIRQTEE